MTPIVRNIFAAGHTARGYVEWFDEVTKGMNRLVVLTGTPGAGKSTLMETVGQKMLERGFDVEWIRSPLDPDRADGVLFPQIRAGVVDGAAPRRITPRAPYVRELYLDLSVNCDRGFLWQHRERILALQQAVDDRYRQAYAAFAEALAIHDEWERFYIANLLPEKAEAVTAELSSRLFGGKSLAKKPFVRHMHFGAATPRGAVDFIPGLTAPVGKRYFIKGRPGSGKSTMLKKLAVEAERRGFDVEVYHCGFDPNSVDMLLLPECDAVIFDSTAPHEYFPERESDEIVDMYERIIRPGVDEAQAAELAGVRSRYSVKMKQATAHLAAVKEARDELVTIYAAAADFSALEAAETRIWNELSP